MFSRSSWLHLRFPFSYFLLPVFLFSLSVSPNFSESGIGWVFFIVHFLLYPASNGYNSYFDKDEKSIGVLKNPPPVNKGLYNLSLLLDALAIVLGYIFINLTFALMLLIYGIVSKAYSHPSVRLKKYAVTSWVVTGLFQGLFTFMMCFIGVNDFDITNALKLSILIPGFLTSLMLWANYPLTQIYQHEEDLKRGDKTMSIRLGIKGTFFFAAGFFVLTLIGFFFYLKTAFQVGYAFTFIFCLFPIIAFFIVWFFRVLKDAKQASYENTMLLTFISATCLNGFFIYLFLDSTQVIQALRGGF